MVRNTRSVREANIEPINETPEPTAPATPTKTTHLVESNLTITRFSPSGQEVLLSVNASQPDAPITTVLSQEAAELEKQARLLAVGAEAAALNLEGPLKTWALELAARCRDLDLIPVARS